MARHSPDRHHTASCATFDMLCHSPVRIATPTCAGRLCNRHSADRESAHLPRHDWARLPREAEQVRAVPRHRRRPLYVSAAASDAHAAAAPAIACSLAAAALPVRPCRSCDGSLVCHCRSARCLGCGVVAASGVACAGSAAAANSYAAAQAGPQTASLAPRCLGCANAACQPASLDAPTVALPRRAPHFPPPSPAAANCSGYDRQLIADTLIPRTFADGEVVLRRDAANDRFWMIVEGEARRARRPSRAARVLRGARREPRGGRDVPRELCVCTARQRHAAWPTDRAPLQPRCVRPPALSPVRPCLPAAAGGVRPPGAHVPPRRLLRRGRALQVAADRVDVHRQGRRSHRVHDARELHGCVAGCARPVLPCGGRRRRTPTAGLPREHRGSRAHRPLRGRARLCHVRANRHAATTGSARAADRLRLGRARAHTRKRDGCGRGR